MRRQPDADHTANPLRRQPTCTKPPSKQVHRYRVACMTCMFLFASAAYVVYLIIDHRELTATMRCSETTRAAYLYHVAGHVGLAAIGLSACETQHSCTGNALLSMQTESLLAEVDVQSCVKGQQPCSVIMK